MCEADLSTTEFKGKLCLGEPDKHYFKFWLCWNQD